MLRKQTKLVNRMNVCTELSEKLEIFLDEVGVDMYEAQELLQNSGIDTLHKFDLRSFLYNHDNIDLYTFMDMLFVLGAEISVDIRPSTSNEVI